MKQLSYIFFLFLFGLGCRPDPVDPEISDPESDIIEGQIGDNKLRLTILEPLGFTSADIEGTWISFGDPDIIEYGFVWGNNNDPQLSPENSKIWKQKPETIIGLNKPFKHTIIDLIPETEYWVRTYMKADGISGKLGTAFPFKTLGIPPSVETGISFDVDATTFSLSGKILDVGSSAIVEYGHIISRSGPPSFNSDKQAKDGPVDIGHEFESTFENLEEGQAYYFNTYAINQSGALALGEAKTVRTEALPNLYIESITMVSDHGNLDDKINRGEKPEYSIKIKNSGSLVANDVRIELIENSSFVTEITPNLIDLGTIPAGNTQAIEAQGIRIQIDDFAAWDSTIIVQLLLSDASGKFWTDSLLISVESPYVVTDGLVAYYTFDRDDTSSFFIDSEVNTNVYKGLKNNGPGYSIESPSGSGYSMAFESAKETFINVPSNPLFDENDRTYSLWIKTSVAGDYLLFEKKRPNRYFFISLLEGFRFYEKFGGEISFGQDVDLVTDDTWHMLTITISGSLLKLYLDGIFVEPTPGGGEFKLGYQSTNEGIIIAALRPSQSTDISGPFEGLMDNIRFYNRVLSSEEIFDLYQNRQ